jgi:protein-S-isoprenylcysteine O-methyltransferase Ste14
MYKTISIVALLAMIIASVILVFFDDLFSRSPIVIAVQACACVLMIWARRTFGFRSFHAAANPTEGGLVTHGPYAYIRHPIYTAICLFIWAGVLAHWSLPAGLLGFLVTSGALARIYCEEKLIVAQYPEYVGYAQRTKRMIPHIF